MKKEYKLVIVGHSESLYYTYKHVMRAFYTLNCEVNVYHNGILIASKDALPIEYYL